jgi:hypothetical protein
MGGAKRYPSIASYGDDGFRRLNPSYILRTRIGRDDLVDACVCAVAARDSASRLGGDEVDISGLQMQINCWRGQGLCEKNSLSGKSVSSPDPKNISLPG